MIYKIDHDYHIHSHLSVCSNDPEQNVQNILKYAKTNGLKKICITDHFWDENITLPSNSDFYKTQNFSHISSELPLPQEKGFEFLFGCETEFDKNFTLAISSKSFELFNFVIIPTTHMHMMGLTIDSKDSSPENRAKLWAKRLDTLLDYDLPFQKIGIAHLACELISPTKVEYLKTLNLISETDMERIFAKAAAKGVGIELNQSDMSFSNEESETVLKMFKIAKYSGCKFYLGSDSHHPNYFKNTVPVFSRAVKMLALTENDKFYINE